MIKNITLLEFVEELEKYINEGNGDVEISSIGTESGSKGRFRFYSTTGDVIASVPIYKTKKNKSFKYVKK